MTLNPTKFAAVLALSLGIAASASATPFPGPDGFGYTGSSIAFNLRNVSGTGADIGLDNTDDLTALSAIGFGFSFYGLAYTQVEVSSNGFLSFTPTGDSACCSADPIPAAGRVDNLIAAWWNDLITDSAGHIRTQTLGVAGSREFVVGFYNVKDIDNPNRYTFEMILHESTNDIELQYEYVGFDDVDDTSAGIENVDGTIGLQLVRTLNSDNHAVGDPIFQRQGFCIGTGTTNCAAATVVPEPATLALMALALGLAGIGMRRRTPRSQRT